MKFLIRLVAEVFTQIGIQIFLVLSVVGALLLLDVLPEVVQPHIQMGMLVICTVAVCCISGIIIRKVVRGWQQRQGAATTALSNTLYLVCATIVIFFFGSLTLLFLGALFEIIRL